MRINSLKIKYLFYLILSLILAYLIIFISQNKEIWLNSWGFLKVPAMWPAFADIDFILRSVQCKQMGHDPFVNNPCDINGTIYQYPAVWLNIFELLNIDNLHNFKIFVFISITFYLFCYCFIFEITKNYFNKFILILLFFSLSSLLLIERGNIDHIIFIFCLLTMVSRNYYFEATVIFFNTYLKVFPFFNFVYLFKKKFLITFLISLITIVIIYKASITTYPIPNDSTNNSFLALSQAFGVITILEGAFKILEKKYLFNINFETKTLVRLLFVGIFFVISIILFFIGSKKYHNSTSNIPHNYEKLFILGSSIYVGRYIFLSNFDYSLVFLILTVPYISRVNKVENYIYSIILVIIFNSWLFSFTPLTISHSLYTIFQFSLKMIIFGYLSFYIGKVSGNFFLNLKFK